MGMCNCVLCFRAGADDFQGFVAFIESIVGMEFAEFVRQIDHRIIMEIVNQAAGSAEYAAFLSLDARFTHAV